MGLDSETIVLEAIQAAEDLEDAHRLARKRLSALKKDREARYRAICKEEHERLDSSAVQHRADGRLPAALRAMFEGKFQSHVLSERYWDEGWSHGMRVRGAGRVDPQFEDGVGLGELRAGDAAALASDLARMGFFASSPEAIAWGEDLSLERIVAGMAEIKSRGWPPSFIFAYQEPWVLLDRSRPSDPRRAAPPLVAATCLKPLTVENCAATPLPARLFVAVATLLSTADDPVSPCAPWLPPPAPAPARAM